MNPAAAKPTAATDPTTIPAMEPPLNDFDWCFLSSLSSLWPEAALLDAGAAVTTVVRIGTADPACPFVGDAVTVETKVFI